MNALVFAVIGSVATPSPPPAIPLATLSSAKSGATADFWRACFRKRPTPSDLGEIEVPKQAKFDANYSATQFADWFASSDGNSGFRIYRFSFVASSQREVGEFFYRQKLVEIDTGKALDEPYSQFSLGKHPSSKLIVQCDSQARPTCTAEFRFFDELAEGESGVREARCPVVPFVAAKYTPVPVPRSVVGAELPRRWAQSYEPASLKAWIGFFALTPPTEDAIGLPIAPQMTFAPARSAPANRTGAKSGRFTYVFVLDTSDPTQVARWYENKIPGAVATTLASRTISIAVNGDDNLLIHCEKKRCTLTMLLTRPNNPGGATNPPRHAGSR